MNEIKKILYPERKEKKCKDCGRPVSIEQCRCAICRNLYPYGKPKNRFEK